MAIKTYQVTASGTASSFFVVPGHGERDIHVANNSATVPVFVGGPEITQTTGYPLAAGANQTFRLYGNDVLYFTALSLSAPITGITVDGLAATITGISGDGTTVTVVATNTFGGTDTVTISGVTPSAYNGTYTLNSASGTGFTFLSALTNTYTSGGTATRPSTTVTVTATNSFAAGQVVSITGVTPSTLNISGTLATVSGSGFTVSNPVVATYVSGGTAVAGETAICTVLVGGKE